MNPLFMAPTRTIEEGTGVKRAFSHAALTPVWQLNALFLETLIQSSRHPAWRGSSWDNALGPSLPDALPILREDLSRSPVSLVDIGLNDDGAHSPLSEIDRKPARTPPPFLTRDRAIYLAQVTLSLAWNFARSDIVATSIVFGIPRSRAIAIGALAFDGLPKMSVKLSSTVQPSWMNEPRVWQRLLSFSERSAALRLAPIGARTLQRQFADLLPATSASHLLHSSRRYRRASAAL